MDAMEGTGALPEGKVEYTDYEVGWQDARLHALDELTDALNMPVGDRKWEAGEWWIMLLNRVRLMTKRQIEADTVPERPR